MPMSVAFENRLYPRLDEIVAHFGTPFHIYDETGIRETGQQLKTAFAGIPGFREYFAVKALPNPAVLAIMADMGFGFDCSSVAELDLSRRVGALGEDLMFTSNNTTRQEFSAAMAGGGSILNLDDISLIDKLPAMPELICFRYNPGERRTGNAIIGTPVEAKYGVSHDQLVRAYEIARDRGAKRFGLHTMLASNERDCTYMVQTAAMLLEQVERLSSHLNIRFEFINIGGGLGIPYQPGDSPLDLMRMSREITALFKSFADRNGSMPRLFMESGRYMTGPHGVLVTRAINRKEIYRTYVGVDACMSSLMRPGMYNAYHHITVPGKTDRSTQVVDVVGSLCENNDKFAIQRPLPAIAEEDRLVIHDTGAHGHAMGFNYNGKLRPKELLLGTDGTISLIRREERLEDYFATLSFTPDTLALGPDSSHTRDQLAN
ncbi:diaminopimelate decarboxylase [Desulfosarcina ovata subsp. sediminis]|uniref:Diaminopimelate decarboxylase n=1 Tax=Desulfosarcina ovata subsp. sediminis TaxID=885957 RepID=A0A5K7ZFY5_9BACT|nr:diaminopimelate decarboxylase [Desulfosarcina ovata]BBO79866.1 diaminopimelate decarboxylase [Desulfosarcina ovata subsp. sediminis]